MTTTTERTDARRDGWMQTYTGRKFWPLNPDPADVDIIDIAHSLSMQCRYNGHTRLFYSVAEHCVHLSHHVPAEDALWALLHDAAEAYIGDMVRPLKQQMPEFRTVDDAVTRAVTERYGLPPGMPESVRAADLRILLDERDVLMGEPAGDWDVPGEPLGVRIEAWTPQRAKSEFLAQCWDLLP